jgi:hypothetical protein
MLFWASHCPPVPTEPSLSPPVPPCPSVRANYAVRPLEGPIIPAQPQGYRDRLRCRRTTRVVVAGN